VAGLALRLGRGEAEAAPGERAAVIRADRTERTRQRRSALSPPPSSSSAIKHRQQRQAATMAMARLWCEQVEGRTGRTGRAGRGFGSGGGDAILCFPGALVGWSWLGGAAAAGEPGKSSRSRSRLAGSPLQADAAPPFLLIVASTDFTADDALAPTSKSTSYLTAEVTSTSALHLVGSTPLPSPAVATSPAVTAPIGVV